MPFVLDWISIYRKWAIVQIFLDVSIFNALAIKNKDKELKLKVCTNELKEIKDKANDVIQTVKKSKRSNTEDPAAMKSALKELHLAIETFLNKCSGNYGVDE